MPKKTKMEKQAIAIKSNSMNNSKFKKESRKYDKENKKSIIQSIKDTKPTETFVDVLNDYFHRDPNKKISTQKTIPYIKMFPNGICKVEKNIYNMQIEFDDINYFLAPEEEQDKIFDLYCKLLNYFDASITAQFTFTNTIENPEVSREKIMLPKYKDGYEDLRKEYQDMLEMQAEKGNNGLIRKKYLTVSVYAKTDNEAKNKLFAIIESVEQSFRKMEVHPHTMDGDERLESMYNIMNDTHNKFNYTLDDVKKYDCSSKDLIAPKFFDFKEKNIYRMGKKYCQAQYFTIACNELSDHLLSDLLKLDQEMIINIFVEAIDQQKIIKNVRRKITDLNMEKINMQKKANQSGYDMDITSPELAHDIDGAEDILHALQNRDERWFNTTILVTNIASSKNKLDKQIIACKGIVQKYQCDLIDYDNKTEDCLKAMLPLDINKLYPKRGLTTSATATFMPFVTKELFMPGFYYGLNSLSNNMIMADRRKLMNPNGLILGVPGAGKSFSAKREMINAILLTHDDVLICDPNREYEPVVEAFGGETVKISATSTDYINPLDINMDYNENEDPIIVKSEFILSMMELLMKPFQLSPKQKSMLDICVRKIYQKYFMDPKPENIPVLGDLKEALESLKDKECDYLADSLTIYVTGSMSVFNHHTNVDIENRLMSFDIYDLGKNLKPFGMLVVQDHVWNRVSKNKKDGKKTWYYIDEFHLLLKDKETTAYSIDYWKMFRKFGGIPTGITQNVKDFLSSMDVEGIFDNTVFYYLLRQAPGDREILCQKLNISDLQQSYITDNDKGSGLIIYNGVIVPFKDRFPKTTTLYWLMTTDPSELEKQRQVVAELKAKAHK